MTLLLLSTTIDERYSTARIACFITATNLGRLWILGEWLLFMRQAVQEKVTRRYWFIISIYFLAFLATAVFSVIFGAGALSQEGLPPVISLVFAIRFLISQTFPLVNDAIENFKARNKPKNPEREVPRNRLQTAARGEDEEWPLSKMPSSSTVSPVGGADSEGDGDPQ
ncbi:hypothetical protein B0I35DRAFT_446018 [Stachybotrys elegans]|uniref:Uncharacterized protein n=1 Tax=Stachybotrys elegans TaxID=80388 RepID=A0A8K0SBJ8_9HYPO|nr:hypothetical protein B0I35DRAFT_446018 [Stachybotrys elegans]